MADILLSRPQAGQQVVVPAPADARLVLQFPVDQASLEKAGNNLLFKFGDGSSVELQNFYTEYSKEHIPDFVVDGQLVAGKDFFNAVGPDLSPAAGPGAAAATGGGRYTDWGNSNLENGINHLNGLDWGMNLASRDDYDVNALGSPYYNAPPVSSLAGAALVLDLKEAGVRAGGNVPEPGTPTMSGSFTVTDPDGDSLTAIIMGPGGPVAVSGATSVVTPFGVLTVTPSGLGSAITYTVTYTLNNADGSQTDRLALGESHSDVFSIQISDGRGNTMVQPVNVYIAGSNDAPDITAVDDLALKEQGVFSGAYGVKDASTVLDPAENTTTQPDGIGADEHRLAMSGQITAVDPDHNAVLTYGFTDKGGAALVVGSVVGTGPGGPVTVTAINATDPTNITISTSYGELHLNAATGAYSFNLTNMTGEGATNKLAEGQLVALEFRPTVHDEHNARDLDCNVLRNGASPAGGNILDVTILGSNDQPVFAGSAGWSDASVLDGSHVGVQEATDSAVPTVIHGQMTATDHDNGASLTYGFAHGGQLVATLYAVPTGVGHGYTLETAPPADGNYFGTFSMTNQANGSYSFTLNNAAHCVDSLNKNDHLDVTAPMVAKDEFGAWSTTPLNVYIKGANDAPAFTGGPYTGEVKESGVFAAGVPANALVSGENAPAVANAVFNGDLASSVHDVDAGDTHTFGLALAPGGLPIAASTLYALDDGAGGYYLSDTVPSGNDYYGQLSMGADGKYTFTVNNTPGSPADKLPEGGEFKLAFTPTVSDGTVTTVADAAHQIEITIKGTNDAPVLTVGDNLAVTEQGFANPGSPASASGTVTGSDVDSDNQGNLTFSLVQDASLIGGGAAVPLHDTLYVVDNGSGTLTLSATPPTPATVDKYYGTLTMASAGPDKGTYTFTLNNNSQVVQQLDDVDVKNLSFTVAVQDSHGAYDYKSIGLSIKGSNDAPTFKDGPYLGAVKESGVFAAGDKTSALVKAENDAATDAKATFSGDLASHVHDVDAGDTHMTFGLALGGVPIAGDTLYAVSTGPGAYTLSATVPSGNTSYGSLTMGSDGKYTFTLNDTPGSPADKLPEGGVFKLAFTPTVSDGTATTVAGAAHQIEITIKGTNDAPVLLPGGNDLEVREQGFGVPGTATAFGIVTGSDVDSDNQGNLSFSLVQNASLIGGSAPVPVYQTLYVVDNGSGTPVLSAVYPGYNQSYGTLTMVSAGADKGKYTFTLHDGSTLVQKMDTGDVKNLSFTVAVQDKHGAYDYRQFNLNIKGSDDAPNLLQTWGGRTVKESGVYAAGGEGYPSELNPNEDTDTTLTVDNPMAPSTPIASGQHLLMARGFVAGMDQESDKLTYTLQAQGANTLLAASEWSNPPAGYSPATAQALTNAYGTLYLKTAPTDSHGSVNVDVNNSEKVEYVFVLNDKGKEVNALAEGQSTTTSFDIRMAEAKNGSVYTDHKITFTIRGTNDKPVLDMDASSTTVENAATLSFTEDGGTATYVATGTVKATDVDAGDAARTFIQISGSNKLVATAFVDKDGQVVESVSGTDYYGRISLDATTGKYTFELNNNAPCVQHLSGGELKDLPITIVAQDKFGAFDKGTLHVKVTGADDPTVLAMDMLNPTHTLVEAGVLPGGNTDYAGKPTAEGTIKATDPDTGDILHYSVQGKDGLWHELGKLTDSACDNTDPAHPKWVIAAAHGTITVTANADGSWHYAYTLNNEDTAVNALDRAATLGDGFKVQAASQYGNPVEGQVQITIVGTNDRPAIVAQKLDVDGDGVLDQVITIAKADTDNALDGMFKGRILTTDPDTSHVGSEETGTYNLVVSGGGGKSFVPAYYKDAGGAAHQIGSVSIQPDGSYTFELNSDGRSYLRGVAEGEYLDVYTNVRVKDPYNAYDETRLHWRLEGQNDNPVLTPAAGTVTEDGWKSGRPGTADYAATEGVKEVSGVLSATKVDQTATGVSTFTYGLDSNNDGKPDAAHDLYVLADKTFSTILPSGDYLGLVHLESNGTWKFTLNNGSATVNALTPGERIDLNIPVAVEDGRGYTGKSSITVHIEGANDQPVLATAPDLHLADLGHVEASYVATGTAAATDVDNAASELRYCFMKDGQPVQTLQLDHGTVSIDAVTGQYTYTFDVFNDANYGSDGKTPVGMQEKFTVYARDPLGAYSNPQNVTVAIDPHDKWGTGGPGGSGANLTFSEKELTATEDGGNVHGTGGAAVSVAGTVSGGSGYFFVGAGGAHVQSVPAVDAAGNSYGSFTINPITGKCTFVLDNSSDKVQELDGNDTITLVKPTVSSHAGGSVTVPGFVQGTADAPVFLQKTFTSGLAEDDAQHGGQSVVGSVAKDGAGHSTVQDLDKGDMDHLTFGPGSPTGAQTVSGNVIHGTYGDLLIKADGSYTYTVRDGVNIPHGRHVETFNVTVRDNGYGGDASTALSDTATVVINLDGRNTPPVYNGSALAVMEVTEDIKDANGLVVATGQIDTTAFSDADGDSVSSFGVSTSESGAGTPYALGTYGTLFIKSDGTYEYRLNNETEAVQGLKAGDTATDSFFVIASDGHGGTTSIPLNVTVTGTEDAPVLSLNSSGVTGAGASLDMVAGQKAAIVGQAVATDVDVKDTAAHNFHYSLKDGAKGTDGKWHSDVYTDAMDINNDGTPDAHVKVGEMVLDPVSGAYEFLPDKSLEHLAGGQQITVKAAVLVNDGQPGNSAEAEVQVHITGTNDAPVLNTPGHIDITALLKSSGNTPVVQGATPLTATDPDAGPHDAATTFSIKVEGPVTQTGPTTWHGIYGTLTLQPNGSYSYTLDKSDAVYELSKDQPVQDVFTVLAKDMYGATSTTSKGIVVNVTGTNDGPVLSVSNLSVHERTAESASASSEVSFIDKNPVDVHHFSIMNSDPPLTPTATDPAVSHGTYGDFTLYADGHYTYTLTSTALNQGQTAAETFTVRVFDKDGLFSTRDVTVNITGSNDAPVATVAEHAGWSGTWATDKEHDALTFISQDPAGTEHFGAVHAQADGTYTYTLHTGEAALTTLNDALRANAEHKITDTFAFEVKDTHTGSGEAAHTGTLGIDIAVTPDGDVYKVDLHTSHNGAADTLFLGGTGADEIHGGAGNDILYGGSGDDTLYGGDGDDYLFGGDGHNVLYGGAGNDTLHAGNAGDMLYGGDGNDHLYGGSGNDYLDGGAGQNVLEGGAGHDIFMYHAGDKIDGGEGTDVLLTTGNDSMDSILQGLNGPATAVKGIEVVVQGADMSGVTSLTNLKGLGVTVGDDGKVSVDETSGWTKTGEVHDAANAAFTVYTHSTDGTTDLTLAVAMDSLKSGT